MTQENHAPIKAEKIVQVGVAALEDNLVLPGLFRREGIEKFKGAKDDTVNVTVDGVLPFRTYGWRNDRTASIVFDEYKERKVAVSFGDDIYSAVRLTDEQAEMDFAGWTKLATKQVEAIGRGLEYKAADALVAAPFEVEVQLDEGNMRGSLIRLQSIFDKLKVPGRRTIVVDADTQVALLDDEKLNLREFVGDGEAVPALKEAHLGRRYTFDFVKAGELPNGTSVAMTDGGFIFLTAAPGVPRGASFGATASHNGVALQWIMDYDVEKKRDRSVFTAWQDFHYVDDPLVGRDDITGQAFVSLANHFVRAVKLTVGAKFKVEVANSELSSVTGIMPSDLDGDGLDAGDDGVDLG